MFDLFLNFVPHEVFHHLVAAFYVMLIDFEGSKVVPALFEVICQLLDHFLLICSCLFFAT